MVFLDFLYKCNAEYKSQQYEVLGDLYHRVEAVRAIDFMFTVPGSNEYSLEKLLIFDNESMAFTGASPCEHVDPAEIDDLLEKAYESESLNWRQHIYKQSLEHVAMVTSPHNKTNIRATHATGDPCSCNAEKRGSLAFVNPENFEESYKRLFCLCRYGKEDKRSWRTGGQNLNIITCHANAPEGRLGDM